MTDPDHKPSVEAALDIFVYAPLGLALEARTLMPSLVERGRNQVTMAKMIGRFAVQQGQVEATRRLGPVQQQVEGVLADMGLVPHPTVPAPGPSRTGPTSPGRTSSGSGSPVTTPEVPTEPEPPRQTVAVPDLPEVEDLGVTDYDSLAASQVVPRLRALSAVELEDVRRYEAAGRGRKTILNRIAQLQSR